MARILVTGGAGFIGTAVTKELQKRGHEVTVFDLVSNSKNTDVQSYTGSILDPYEIAKNVRGCDYVIHLAAALGVQRTEARRLECLYINIQGTINVLEACVKEKVKKVLFSSSSEVYGEQAVHPTSEDAPLNPKSNYAITKLVCEEYLRAYRDYHGLDYSIVRFFNVYGEGQVAQFVMPKFIMAVRNNQQPVIYGKGDQVRSFCYVSDAAIGAVDTLFKKCESKIFNIGNDAEPITISELAEKVIACSGKDLTPKFIKMQDSDRTDKREIYKRIPSLERAKKELGYEPLISLEHGIAKVIGNVEIIPNWQK